ncbi:hypothetical protein Tco_0080050 [Tanacetum coccineum]
MKNVNPPSPPESLTLPISRRLRELNKLVKSLNLVAPTLIIELFYFKGELGLERLFKESEDEEIEEEEEEIEQLVLRRDPENPRKVSNFTKIVRGIHVFIGNFTYIMNFLVVEDVELDIDSYLSHVVLGKPFVEISNLTYDHSKGINMFTDGIDEVVYQIPHRVEQYQLMPNLEKDFMQADYVRSKDDTKRGVDYVMKNMFGFYKECLELGPEYKVNKDDIGSMTDDGAT